MYNLVLFRLHNAAMRLRLPAKAYRFVYFTCTKFCKFQLSQERNYDKIIENYVRPDRQLWPNRTGLGSFLPEPDRNWIGRTNRIGRIFTGFKKTLTLNLRVTNINMASSYYKAFINISNYLKPVIFGVELFKKHYCNPVLLINLIIGYSNLCLTFSFFMKFKLLLSILF